MAEVVLEDITKVYPNGYQAVTDVSLDIADGEFIVMVGPSGCGKSTVLRMIAGLEDISGGTLKIDDKVVNHLEPKDRNIAMVFQNYALYPHKTVEQNIGFALKMAKVPKAEIDKRVAEARPDPRTDRIPEQTPSAAVGRAAPASSDGAGDRPQPARPS